MAMLLLLLLLATWAESATLTVDLSKPGHAVSPTLFGQFFEEINHAGVGGLYGELIQNRAFEDGSKNKDQVSLTPVSQPNLFVRHYNYTGYVSTLPDTTSLSDATFNIVPSFYDPTDTTLNSIEATNYPDYYIRHQNFIVYIVSAGNWALPDATYLSDVSFKPVPGLAGGGSTSFQSINYPDHYIAISTTCSAPSGVPRPCYDLILSNNSSAADSSFIIHKPPQAAPSFAPWVLVGEDQGASMLLDPSGTLNSASSHSLRITVPNTPKYAVGAANPGYWGINAVSGASYTLTFYARSSGITTVTAQIQSSDGNTVYATGTATGISSDWKKYTISLTSSSTDAKARAAILTTQSGQIWLDNVSLFPVNTFKGRPGGLRLDLANFLANLKPKFLRFPGGCYVEGITMDTRFNWKTALNAIEDRPGHWDHNWGYWSEDGLGLYEYLLYCEDIGAEPIWVVNNGISHTQQVTVEHLQGYIQDALDSIEFATGSSTSQWGAIRASMGHPDPFKLNFIAIGNEGNIGGPSGAPYYGMRENYIPNYQAFYNAIKSAYPNITLIANTDLTNWYGQSAPTEVYDFHVYSDPQWFYDNVHQWDSTSRSGPKVFVSEYAVTSDCGQGNLNAAVAEAAYMTGLERNSDIVILASYAPLFVNNNDRTWNPDLIVFNSNQVYGTPSYWVQQMFGNNVDSGAKVYPITSDTTTLAVSATASSTTGQVVLKIVNYASSSAATTIKVNGGTNIASTGNWTLLTSSSLNDENSFTNPNNVIPKSSTVTVGSSFSMTFPPYSVNIVRFTATAAY